MARMYGGSKGKSGSTRPAEKKVPTWIGYKPNEIEKLIVKLAKAGKTASGIGVYLRDSYGIPSVNTATGKKISLILEENKVGREIPEDLMSLMERSIQVRKHLERNHKDMTAKRGLELTDSRIRSLIKYYKKHNKLSQDWKFDPERIKLYVG